MKVLHVVPSLDARFGGPSLALRTMAAGLVAGGVAVDVVCADTPQDGLKGWQLQGAEGWRLLALGGWGRRLRICPRLPCWLWRHARQYDVIHVHSLFGFVPMVAMAMALARGVPVVLRPLGTLGAYGLQRQRAWLKACSLRWIEGPLLRRVAAIHCTSLAEQGEVTALGFGRAVCLPLGLPHPDEHGTAEAAGLWPVLGGRRFLLYLSRLDPKKGLEVLLAAWARISANFPGVLLVIAGGGDPALLAALRHQAESLGVEPTLLWVGPVGGAAKQALLRGAALYVLPSRHENFGLALLEAMQHGRPCVASEAVALAAEPACDGALLRVAVGDVQALADAMALLLAEAQVASDLGRRAAEVAANFSISTMTDKLLSLYRNLCPPL